MAFIILEIANIFSTIFISGFTLTFPFVLFPSAIMVPRFVVIFLGPGILTLTLLLIFYPATYIFLSQIVMSQGQFTLTVAFVVYPFAFINTLILVCEFTLTLLYSVYPITIIRSFIFCPVHYAFAMKLIVN